MSTLQNLNTQYTNTINILEKMRLYDDKISVEMRNAGDASTKLKNSLDFLKSLVREVNCDNSSLIMETIAIGEQYLACEELINEYKQTLLSTGNAAKIMKVTELLAACQRKYDELKSEFHRKYALDINSIDALNAVVGVCVRKSSSPILERSEELKQKAEILTREKTSVELCLEDVIPEVKALPECFFIARYPTQSVSMRILKDIGMNRLYQNMLLDLRNQGNVMVTTSYERMEDKNVDEFILAYVLRYIEAFPAGTVNVHIFDQNTSYLYKRLCNCFQSENVGEETRKTVQIHNDLSELSVFRDVICEDIFKKTSIKIPDLYAIHEHDKTDPFNLIVLRDGLVDGSGYTSAENLDIINALTRTGDIGHKCGLRFLIVDDSESFNKNLLPNVKHVINQIKQNCSLQLEYSQNGYAADGHQVEVLHISGDMDTYIQTRALALANHMNSKERSHVSIDEISSNTIEENPGCILYIPVGKTGNTVVDLPFSCKDEFGTVAGQCIGYMVIGQSGSGKSSFFHSLVLNGCIKYSPRDLKFWLLDFKNGGASSKYSNSGLPHIRIIAENNKIDDALCLFQMVLEEMERRTRAFNKSFVDNIVDYNRIAEERHLEYFPRIIIAIDEVQEIFREENASVLQKLISSISTRMRSAGMHFVMVAQNLSEGKSYMLKDAFLPSATGRVCFRVAPDIPRDSGFDDDFIQRKQEISELKTGEAYIAYGKDTIKKVKMAFISTQEMGEKYFSTICNMYPDYADRKPLVIGSKQRLTIDTCRQGSDITYFDIIKQIDKRIGMYTAVIGEDAYRMSPLEICFSQHENSSLLILGNDKQMSSSICASVVVSLHKQHVRVHLFNADRTKVQEEYETIPHAFMYVCQNIGSGNGFIQNHRLNELKDVVGDIYAQYLERQSEIQQADDEDPAFEPVFLVINDLFGIESFDNNEMVERDSGESLDSNYSGGFGFNYDIFGSKNNGGGNLKGRIRENLQEIMSTLVKSGWRYNIHTVLAIKGDPSTWRNSRVTSEVNNVVFFNTTEYADQFENSYYLREMLKNISNEGNGETMAVWSNHKNFSKIRPIIYKLSDSRENQALNDLVRGE